MFVLWDYCVSNICVFVESVKLRSKMLNVDGVKRERILILLSSNRNNRGGDLSLFFKKK